MRLIRLLIRKKWHIAVALLPIGIQAYSLSVFSIYYFHPALKLSVQLFYPLFYLLPERFFLSCGSGGFLSICLPNPITIIPIFIISLIISTFMLDHVYRYACNISTHYGLLITSGIVLAFLIGGSQTAQQMCVMSFRKGGLRGTPFIEKNGVVRFVLDRSVTNEQASYFYKTNGLRYVNGDIKTTAIYAQVPAGQEFSTLCRIKSYSQVYGRPEPPTIDELENPSGTHIAYWEYMDENFCSTGQIDPERCKRLYQYKLPNK